MPRAGAHSAFAHDGGISLAWAALLNDARSLVEKKL
jgi:hypothetical protein